MKKQEKPWLIAAAAEHPSRLHVARLLRRTLVAGRSKPLFFRVELKNTREPSGFVRFSDPMEQKRGCTGGPLRQGEKKGRRRLARRRVSFFLSFFFRAARRATSRPLPPHTLRVFLTFPLYFSSPSTKHFNNNNKNQRRRPHPDPLPRGPHRRGLLPPGAPSSSPSSPPRPPRRPAPSRSGLGTRASGTAGGATSASGPRCRRSRTSTRAGGTSWCRRRTASSPWGEFFFSFFPFFFHRHQVLS